MEQNVPERGGKGGGGRLGSRWPNSKKIHPKLSFIKIETKQDKGMARRRTGARYVRLAGACHDS